MPFTEASNELREQKKKDFISKLTIPYKNKQQQCDKKIRSFDIWRTSKAKSSLSINTGEITIKK